MHYYAESVEFALQHLESGDKVFFSYCNKSFPSCPANSNHNKNLCSECVVIQNKIHSKLARLFPHAFKSIPIGDGVSPLSVESLSHIKNKLSSYSSSPDLKTFQYKNIPIGSLISNQISELSKDAFFLVGDYRDLILDLTLSSIAIYEQFTTLMHSKLIDYAYIWNGRRPVSGAVVYAARSTATAYLTHIVGTRLGDIFVNDGPYIHHLESHHSYISNLENIFLKDANSFYSRQILQNGVEYFERQRLPSRHLSLGQWNFADQFKSEYFKNSSKPILAIFMSTLWEKLGLDDYDPFFYKDELSGLATILDEEILRATFHIVIRLHPHSLNVGPHEKSRLERVISKFKNEKGIEFVLPSSTISSYSLLHQSDIVLSFGSTIGIEAVYSRKPSVLVGPSIYQCLDCNIIPSSHNDLIDILVDRRYEKVDFDRNLNSALVYGAYEYRRKHISFSSLSFKDNTFFYRKARLYPRLFMIQQFLKKSIFKLYRIFLSCLGSLLSTLRFSR